VSNPETAGSASAERLLQAGVRLLRARRVEDAERIFDKLVTITPSDAMAISLRAVARVQQGKRQSALTDIQNALELAPENSSILRRGAQVHRALGSQMKALDLLVASSKTGAPSAATHYAIFQAGIKVGWYREAFEALYRSLELTPDRADHHLSAIELHHNLRDNEKALTLSEQLLANGHALPDLHRVRANILRELGRIDEALAEVDAAMALEEDHPDGRLQAADQQITLGAMERARANLEAGLEMAPERDDIRMALAQLLLWAGQFEAVRLHTSVIEETSAQHGVARRTEGVCHFLEGHASEARPCIDIALEQDPLDAEAMMWLGEILRENGLFDEAVRSIDKGIRATNGYSIASHISRLLTILEQQKQVLNRVAPDAFAELLEFVRPALPAADRNTQCTGDPPEVRRLLGLAHKAFRGNRTSRHTYVLDSDPKGSLRRLLIRPHSRFAARYTQELIRTRPPEDVLARFEQMVLDYPQEPTVFCHIGEMHLWLGNYDLALEGFHGALKITPRVRWAYIGLCAADAMLGNHEQALHWCREGIRVFPPAGRTIHIYRGEIYRRMGRYEEALKDLLQGHAITPGRVTGWMNESLTRHALGEEVDFEEVWGRVAERAPSIVHDAVHECDVSWTVKEPVPADVPRVFEHMLQMMRGNRSSDFITYFTEEGAMRFVPPPNIPDEVFNQ